MSETRTYNRTPPEDVPMHSSEILLLRSCTLILTLFSTFLDAVISLSLTFLAKFVHHITSHHSLTRSLAKEISEYQGSFVFVHQDSGIKVLEFPQLRKKMIKTTNLIVTTSLNNVKLYPCCGYVVYYKVYR